MSVWVPPKVRHELAEQSRIEYRARLWPLFDFDDPVCKRWNPELLKLDPHIKLGRAKPMAFLPGLTVRPGFYHFLRDNPGAPPSCETITGPDGEWTEPDSRLLEHLKANDLQNPAVIVAMKAAEEQRRRREQEERLAEREQRQAEIVERVKAATRTFVSMDRSQPWTQNVAGRRK